MSERDEEKLVVGSAEELVQPATRRKFLRLLGVGGTVVLMPSVFAACDDDDDPVRVQSPPPPPASPPPPPASPPPPPASAIALDLRTDVGIVSFAFVLEQLEAAFYTAVVGANNFGTLFNAAEQEILTDIRNHEVIHREFLKVALTGTAIANQSVAINMTTLNTILSSRVNILNTARRFEDLGVAAYNGAGKYLTNVSNLLVAGKIVSVEARHAAVIRDLLAPPGVDQNRAFAGDDIVDAAGLDVKLEPQAVLNAVAQTQITTTNITISNASPNGTPNATPDRFPANP